MNADAVHKFEDAIAHAKYAPKNEHPAAVEDIIQAIEDDYRALGEHLQALKHELATATKLMGEASNTILDMMRTMSR